LPIRPTAGFALSRSSMGQDGCPITLPTKILAGQNKAAHAPP
jgi:hypothetical protein